MSGTSTTVTLRDLDTTVVSTTDGLFGLTKYPAKFIPQMVNYPLDSWLAKKAAVGSSQGQYLVTDPFAGVGTVAISAHLRGVASELWDINPLMGHYNRAHAAVLSSQSPIMQLATALTDRLHNLRLDDLDREHPVLPLRSESVHYLGDWYHSSIFVLVSHLWQVYYDSPDEQQALLLTPLLRVTNKWSYNDLQRQKLCRSDRKTRLVNSWLDNPSWRQEFVQELIDRVDDAARRYTDHQRRAPRHYGASITIISPDQNATLPVGHGDVVITSPPYLQAQEYIRASKLSLLWLGHSLDEVRTRSKLEIPYCQPLLTQEIASPTFDQVRQNYERDNNKRALALLDS